MVSNHQLKSISMRNLRNNKSSFRVLFDFEPLDQLPKFDKMDIDKIDFDDNDNKMNDVDKLKTARRSLHRYIFIVCHTIQHFGHHLIADELDLLQIACERTLKWMWHSQEKSLESYSERITLLLRICTPLMQRLFQAEQQYAERIDKISKLKQLM